MNIVSAQSAHWTDEQLMDHLYGVGPAGSHLPECRQCQSRLSAMALRRQHVSVDEPVGEELLAAQRRAIYARLSQPHRWWHDLRLSSLFSLRHVAAAAMVIVLGSSAAVYEKHRKDLAEFRADAQLATEVSQMSFESEPPATAPLQGLFIE